MVAEICRDTRFFLFLVKMKQSNNAIDANEKFLSSVEKLSAETSDIIKRPDLSLCTALDYDVWNER